MKSQTTNYHNTLIAVAEDCPVTYGEEPPIRGNKKSVANYQVEMVYEHPYEYTSDDLIFAIHAIRKGIEEKKWEVERKNFFSRDQPCLRASPLAKRYGWGIHSDKAGRIALYGAESKEYEELLKDDSVAKVKAMRSRRK